MTASCPPSLRRSLPGTLTIAALALPLWTPLLWAKRVWLAPDSPLSFQPLILFAAAALLWGQLPFLRRLHSNVAACYSANSPKLHGSFVLCVLGAVLFVLSYAAQSTGIGIFAGVISVAGIVLAVWGRIVWQACLPLLCFLLLSVPPPDSVVAKATQKLQLACSAMAGYGLNLLQTPCAVEGNVLHVNGFRLEVAGACSGMSILFPLIAITIWLVLRKNAAPLGKAGSIFIALSALVAVVLNVVRLITMGMIAARHPLMVARLHDASGWLFTLAGFAVMYYLVDQFVPTPTTRWSFPFPQAENAHESDAAKTARTQAESRLLRCALLFFMTGGAVLGMQAQMNYAGQWLLPLPNQIQMTGTGNTSTWFWEGRVEQIAPNSLDILGNPRADARTYQNPLGETVSVSVVSAGSFDAYHEPSVCLLGQGYYVTAERILALDTAHGGGNNVRTSVFRGPSGARFLMLYWLQNRSGTTSTDRLMGVYRDMGARLRAGWRAVGQREQTCIVRVVAAVENDDYLAVQARRNTWEIARAVHQTGLAH